MTPDLSVVVPCYNEEENLEELVERLRRTFAEAGIAGEIVLVNDGSRDRTGAVIDALAARHPEVVGCHHAVNRGMEAGWNSGVAAAHGTHVCFIDADLQYQPEDVARLWAARGPGIDIVQGTRNPAESLRDQRLGFSRGLNHLLNLAFGMALRDNKSGFVLGRREVIAHTLQHQRPYRYFQALLLVSAHARGYRIREVDVPFVPRQRGQSFMSAFPIRVVWGCLRDVAEGLREFRVRP